jgi:hypothetical protein
MSDPPDYDLLKSQDETSARMPPKRSVGVWIVTAALVAGAVVAAYIVFGRQPVAPETAAHTEAPPEKTPPLGGAAAPIAVPPLDQSDALVRDLVKTISSHPSVVSWLATDGLIRNFALGVSNVADGKSAAGQLHTLRPATKFSVLERGGDTQIDPRSYARYDALAAAAASLDPAGSARVYATLKPRIEEAYRELGPSNATFDQVLQDAIVLLLRTPTVSDPVRVEPRGVGYGFAAPDLEALAPAQKQLLRFGPRNVRLVKAALRQLALALGIPAARLPRADDPR